MSLRLLLRRRRSRRGELFGLGAICLCLSAPIASAGPGPAAPATPTMTKAQCVAANETGQDLRRSGKLHEAQASLAACLAASCPGAVREDCAQRLAEIEQAVPTVVLVAVDGAGKDLSAVHVALDGQPWLDALDGKASIVNPGEHRFRFEADGLPANEATVVVAEGEKNRTVRVVLAPVAPVEQAPVPPPAGGGLGAQRTIGIGLAAGGVVLAIVGAVFGAIAKSTEDNAVSQCRNGDPNDCAIQGVNDSHTAYGQATISTGAFIAAGALLAGGAVVYFTARHADRPAVGLAVGDRSIGVRGVW
jgi:hypothetical protein